MVMLPFNWSGMTIRHEMEKQSVILELLVRNLIKKVIKEIKRKPLKYLAILLHQEVVLDLNLISDLEMLVRMLLRWKNIRIMIILISLLDLIREDFMVLMVTELSLFLGLQHKIPQHQKKLVE